MHVSKIFYDNDFVRTRNSLLYNARVHERWKQLAGSNARINSSRTIIYDQCAQRLGGDSLRQWITNAENIFHTYSSGPGKHSTHARLVEKGLRQPRLAWRDLQEARIGAWPRVHALDCEHCRNETATRSKSQSTRNGQGAISQRQFKSLRHILISGSGYQCIHLEAVYYTAAVLWHLHC